MCMHKRESVLWVAAKGGERLNLKFHEVKGWMMIKKMKSGDPKSLGKWWGRWMCADSKAPLLG